MLVTRRKNIGRNGQAKFPIKEDQENHVSPKGRFVHQGVNKEEMETDVIEKSPKANLLYNKPSHSCVRLDSSNQGVDIKDPCHMELGHDVSESGMEVEYE